MPWTQTRNATTSPNLVAKKAGARGTKVVSAVFSESDKEAFMPAKKRESAEGDADVIDSRLEKARIELLATLTNLRVGTLSEKEADAVEAAIEDELIALRVGLFRRRDPLLPG